MRVRRVYVMRARELCERILFRRDTSIQRIISTGVLIIMMFLRLFVEEEINVLPCLTSFMIRYIHTYEHGYF